MVGCVQSVCKMSHKQAMHKAQTTVPKPPPPTTTKLSHVLIHAHCLHIHVLLRRLGWKVWLGRERAVRAAAGRQVEVEPHCSTIHTKQQDTHDMDIQRRIQGRPHTHTFGSLYNLSNQLMSIGMRVMSEKVKWKVWMHQ